MFSPTLFVCQHCGNEFSKWSGRCAACGEWNSLVETKVSTRLSKVKSLPRRPADRTGRQAGQKSKVRKDGNKPVVLAEISQAMETKRSSTGMGEVDRVLGGGIVPGSVVLLSGEPGVGKSTLLLQLAIKSTQIITDREQINTDKVLYISAEESVYQLAGRARRLEPTKKLPINMGTTRVARTTGNDNVVAGLVPALLVFAETDLENIITQIERFKPSLVIVDSIQALETEALTSGPGSIGQVRECASQLTKLAKEIDASLFIVGHITKEGAIAGPKILEHIVDTVLYFEGERYRDLRLLRSSKNRFGPTDEVGVFSMDKDGLKEVNDPSELFLGRNKREKTPNLTCLAGRQARKDAKIGSCLVVALEGTRPLMAEIQALVVSSNLVQPRRVANGISYQRLLMLAAICQKQLHLPLFKADVYVNVSGGLTINEPAADLGICLAIYSSSKNKPLKNDLAALGEVGLLGEIRPIAQLEKRIKEASRLGFKTIISSQNASNLAEAVKQAVVIV